MNKFTALEVESLEDRLLLSTVQIYAAGGSGQETLALRIDDQVVAEFTNVGGDASAREYIELEYQTDQTITAGQIRLDFTNDLYDATTGLDRNLYIDRIIVDGESLQTEAPPVYHTGLWQNGGVTDPGFLATETLNINGSVFFSDVNAIRPGTNERQVTFVAKGTTGDEIVSLSIDGVEEKTFQLSQINQQYQFKSNRQFTLDQVQLSFVNDLYDAETGVDRNVVLKFLEFENLGNNDLTRLSGDSSEIYSTGTWRAEDGVTPGFGRGNTLHSNGFFRFADEPTTPPSTGSGSLIRFAAAGRTGEEIAQLLVNDEVVFETELTGTFTSFGNVTRSEYQVILDQDIGLGDIKLAFVNDGLAESGVDRDLLLDYIYVRDQATGEVQRTTGADTSTFSTGTYVEGTLESGTGRGFTLHTNGYFQFANSSRILVSASGTAGDERFQVLVGEQVVGEFGVGDGTQVEWETERTRQFIVDIAEAVVIDDVRIQFINDGVGADGNDRNLQVFAVRLDGRAYDTDSAFSTGSYLESDGVVPGTGRGSILHTNGYFQFGAVSDAGQVSLPNYRSSAKVSARWLPIQNTSQNPFGPFTTVREENGDIIVRLQRNFGLDAGSMTFQVLPSSTQGGPVPGNVSQEPVTVVFEDGQIAANLVIPIEDNNVADTGFFEIRSIDASSNLINGVGFITAQIQDQDGP